MVVEEEEVGLVVGVMAGVLVGLAGVVVETGVAFKAGVAQALSLMMLS